MQDFFNQLDEKVTTLIEGYNSLKSEKENFEKEIENKNAKIEELEGENSTLRNEMQALKDTAAEHKNTVDAAAGKVKELITKLEAVL